MKRLTIYLTLFILVCFGLSLPGCKSSREINISSNTEIDSIASRYLPDQRMGIWNIHLKKGRDGMQILAGETTIPEAKAALTNTLSKHINNFIDSVIVLPDTSVNKKYMGLATLSVINIRKHPQQSAELVSQALLGTPVMILKSENYWFLIQTPDNYIGWVEEASVVPLTITEFKKWKHSDRVISLVSSGWIYATPYQKEVVGDFVSGCILVKAGEEHGFTRVSLPDGRSGYIESKAVTDFNSWKAGVKCTGDSIVRCAAKFMGLPYLWGGSSSKGVDCSGLSKTVYFLNGLILFRDASQQALHGLNVDITPGYKNLRPGDLLFFGSMKDSKPHVTHVAVYKGDTEFIHSSGRVMISSLDSSRSNYSGFRKSSLLSAKRILGIDNDPGIVSVNSHPWY
jgi:gamma-D-glutamyl-L-lysine dipeptidyl-peptidase